MQLESGFRTEEMKQEINKERIYQRIKDELKLKMN